MQRSLIKAFFVAAVYVGVFAAIGLVVGMLRTGTIPGSFGGMLAGVATALVAVIVVVFTAHRILYWVYKTKPLDADTARVCRDLLDGLWKVSGSRRPPPQLWVYPALQPNMFSGGLRAGQARIVMSAGVFRVLNEDEQRAALAIEVVRVQRRAGHLRCVLAVLAATPGIVWWSGMLMTASGASRFDPVDEGWLAALVNRVLTVTTSIFVTFGSYIPYTRFLDVKGAELTGDIRSMALALKKMDVGALKIPNSVSRVIPGTAPAFAVAPVAGRAYDRWLKAHPTAAERISNLSSKATAIAAEHNKAILASHKEANRQQAAARREASAGRRAAAGQRLRGQATGAGPSRSRP